MFITSFRREAWLSIGLAGLIRAGDSFCQSRYWGKSFEASSSPVCEEHLVPESCPSMATSKGLRIRDCSARSSARCTTPTGWSTRRSHSAGQSTCCSTWPATRIGAISNHRLVSFDGHQVTFRWKDYAHDNKQKTMTLRADDFLRTFLLHVLPRS